jgi:hypothetical protein
MSDAHLTYVAVAFELSALLVVAGLFLFVPVLRHRLAVLLGSLGVPMLFYVALFIQWVTSPPGSSIQWVTGGVWLMTLVPFVVPLLVGAILAFVPRPRNVWWRVVVGFICAPLGIALLIGVSRFVFAA